MSSYEALAGRYDALTADVHYEVWADYAEKHFRRAGLPVHTVLDLACGTGSLTCRLAERGYEMIGVDQSEEMLAVAAEKGRAVQGEKPIFLHQSMQELDLYGTIDACVCCLDSVNYVLQPEKLARAFRLVWENLAPGGLFLFDADTPEKLAAMDGQIFLDETEDDYCVWRGEYSARRRVCSFWMDIFRRDGAVWRRGEELHEEYAYSMTELEEYLRAAGFARIKQYGELKFRAPVEGEQRTFFAARKGETVQ